MWSARSSHPNVFLGKDVLKRCRKFTGEHPCRSPISVKFLCNFIEIVLRLGCSPLKLLHIFSTSFYKNISRGLFIGLLNVTSTHHFIVWDLFIYLIIYLFIYFLIIYLFILLLTSNQLHNRTIKLRKDIPKLKY